MPCRRRRESGGGIFKRSSVKMNATRAGFTAGLNTILGTVAFTLIGGAESSHSVLWLLLFAVMWFLSSCFWKETDRRLQICFGTAGALMTTAAALGARLDSAGYTGWAALGLCLVFGVSLAPAAGQLFIWLYRGVSGLKKPVALSPRKGFWVTLAVLVLCWLPVLLAFYPGITGYDIDGHVWQIYTGDYHTHHPLLYTLFMELFMKIGLSLFGSYSVGYGFFTIAQYLLLALSIAYAMYWLCRVRSPRLLWWGLLVFFALSPQHMMMSISGTKDVLFAAAMLVMTVELIRFLLEKDRAQNPWIFAGNIVITVIVCLLRNNMIYGLAALVFVCVVLFRKKLGMRVIAMLLAGLVAAYGSGVALEKITGASKGSVREMVCIPAQQLSRVYALYGLNEPVGYEVLECFPYAADYHPERADHVKRLAEVDTPDRMIKMIKLWVREAFNFPIEYIDAFLFTTKAYWHFDDVSFSTTYNDPENDRGCMIVWHNPATMIDMQDLWPQVKALCEDLFARNQYMQFPVLWTLIHPALYTWLLVFLLAAGIYRRNKPLLLTGGLALCYLLTLLLGPVALIRYQYNLMLIAPVLLCWPWSAGKELTNHD